METITLILRKGKFFKKVYHYVIRLEFHGRKTVHTHVAAWGDPAMPLAGRSNSEVTSLFVQELESLFGGSSIDVQEGSGCLNYINGYVVKEGCTMDFQPDSLASGGGSHTKWRTTYRLLCKAAPGLSEVYVDFGGYPHMAVSYTHLTLPTKA